MAPTELRHSDGTADDVTEQLLPSPTEPSTDSGIEMTSVTIDPFEAGGTARRRARVMQRLESLDAGIPGDVDKEKLADIVNDVVMAETGRRWLRSKALLLMAVLLLMVTVSVYGTTWTVIRSLHSRVDHLSDHISAASMGSDFPTRRPSIVLEHVSRFVRQQPVTKETLDKRRGAGFGLPAITRGDGRDKDAAAQLVPIDYVDEYSGASVPRSQVAVICAAVDKGELDMIVHFKGGVMEGGWPGANGSSQTEGRTLTRIELGRKRATITDASLCDDPTFSMGTLTFKVQADDKRPAPWGSRIMWAKIACPPGSNGATACPFMGRAVVAAGIGFSCEQDGNQTQRWICPELSFGPFKPVSKSQAELSKLCGSPGTCLRDVTTPKVEDQPNPIGFLPKPGIKELIEPADGCILFHASSLQCLRCEGSCPAACIYADAPFALTCLETPGTPGCNTCTIGVGCRQQFCRDMCIPAHMSVTVSSQSARPKASDRRPCCNSTAGTPWTLQSDLGATQNLNPNVNPNLMRCYPA